MIEGFDKMTSALKTIVSKNKRRYQANGYDLDLAYISERLIAMGYPSEKVEALFRNSLEEVKQFLDEMHKDHYRIYNLCSEREYDAKKFHGRVVNFPFDDHNPPNFNTIRLFCEDAEKWLKGHKDNVCVVHCKAGKGRTGVMICCFLLHSNRKWTADEALSYYGKARTFDSKGVTIPSQKRYISYYYHYLREQLDYHPGSLHLDSVSLSSAFPSLITQNITIYVEVHQMNKCEPSTNKIFESKGFSVKRADASSRLEIPIDVFVSGDVKIEFYSKASIQTKKELFHIWFNTAFVEVQSDLSHTLTHNNRNSGGCSNGGGGPLALGPLLKDASISDEHLLSERLSSDSSGSSNPPSSLAESHHSSSSSSFRDKRVRHSSVPQTTAGGGRLIRNNSSSSCSFSQLGKMIELSLSKSQLDKFPKDKSSRRMEDSTVPLRIRLIKPQKHHTNPKTSWSPPPIHNHNPPPPPLLLNNPSGPPVSCCYSSSPESSSSSSSSSNEEAEEQNSSSDVFQNDNNKGSRPPPPTNDAAAARQTWI
eukprot:TRINITY_DN738_c1_g1_i1.p1 TRINITY_DN738_c1_g1~~TRINITY_DN738_c1_g1_i1.p1  ORF type:complete len:535 (-),score=206.88 TRINITY_DN738_c1_g1_i1:873-2477(-)